MDESRKEKGIELLRQLSEAHGAPGQEGEVRRIFRRAMGDTATTDGFGNIICEKQGTSASPRIMLAAHMDEVALMVQAITAEGWIRFIALGGWWAHTLLAKRVRIRTCSGEEIPGVVGAKPPHFLSDAERDKLVKIEDMFIDVGARDADEVKSFGIKLGDTIVPESPFVRMHNPDYLLSKAFDDRAGLAVILHAAQELDKEPHPNTVMVSGTVQEEVGMRGAQTAAFVTNPDVAVLLEGAPADDMPGSSREERQCALGSGVQIRVIDASAIMSRKLVDFVIETAEKQGIAHQIAVRRQGGTDAAPIQRHGSGIPTVVLGVPARYVHTHNAIINISDYLSALDLALAVLRAIDEKTVKSFSHFDD